MEKEKLIALIEKAKSGNQKAVEDLLCQAHTSVSYQCRKMLPNVQDAEDLTQEILLTVYQKLDTLQEPAAFWGWLSRITATRCMNALSRTHVDLQFAEDEDGNSVLDSLETLDERQIPDKAIDNAETARMIDEIVSNLPEAQRMATLLYYYNEMSVKEIAQITGARENTVKGRLNLARKAIKEKVQDYEKQGVKLYSISVLPLLWYFLRSAAQSEADAAAATACAANVVAAGTANSPAGIAKTAGTAATRTAGLAAKKIIAGIIAGAVAAGGVAVAAIHLINEFADTVPAVICQHEWADANCVESQTCHKCGSTEGAALGHEWVDADCENPKACTVCSTTEGMPLGHEWTEADCETAKTCAVCSMTDGEPLGHDWQEADCWVPRTCKSCSITEGDILTPGFEIYGLETINAELDTWYRYVTCGYENTEVKTVGRLKFMEHSVYESDETHEAAEGYEWHTVKVWFEFDDNNANYCGYSCRWLFSDYYSPGKIRDTHMESGAELTNTVLYKGKEYSECIRRCDDPGKSYRTWTWRSASGGALDFYYLYQHAVVLSWRVPVGYDGVILGFLDASVNVETGQEIYEFINENSLLFRFDNAGEQE